MTLKGSFFKPENISIQFLDKNSSNVPNFIKISRARLFALQPGHVLSEEGKLSRMRPFGIAIAINIFLLIFVYFTRDYGTTITIWHEQNSVLIYISCTTSSIKRM